MGQTGRRSIATHILAVKIALAAAHFHGIGVAHAGPWNTSVNRGLEGLECSSYAPLIYRPSLPPRCIGRYRTRRTKPGSGQTSPASGASLATPPVRVGSPTLPKRGTS